MTIELSKEHEIRRLHDAEKWKRGTIVAGLHVHADVVDRVLDRGADHALILAPRPSLVDPYAPFIDETLKGTPPTKSIRALCGRVRMMLAGERTVGGSSIEDDEGELASSATHGAHVAFTRGFFGLAGAGLGSLRPTWRLVRRPSDAG